MTVTIHPDRNEPKSVSFTDTHTIVTLVDGRIIGVPLSWTTFLQDATPEQRQDFIFGGRTIYWERFDDGIDLDAMISGQYTQSHVAEAD